MSSEINEQEIVSAMKQGIYKKLIYKLVEAPYRFNSFLNPFDFKTKLEQSFLRSLENSYLKWIRNQTLNEFLFKGFDAMKNRYRIMVVDNKEEDTYKQVSISFTHVLKDEKQKLIYVIEQKKRDVSGKKESIKLIEKFIEKVNIFSSFHKDYQIIAWLWFMDDEYTINKEYFEKSVLAKTTDIIDIRIAYGEELYKTLEFSTDWLSFRNNLLIFKNHKHALEMPNINTDPEALEVLVNMSNSSWEKLNSNVDSYREIRQLIFDLNDTNSNLYKAFEERKNILNKD